jgi:MoxR-like ATPase
MSEGTVSVDGVTHPLPEPFFVIATQNPLEHHGTHPLPESQLDRFLMRLSLGYPSAADEADVLRTRSGGDGLRHLASVLDIDALHGIQAAAEQVKVDDSVVAYLLALVEETRSHEALELGASTRGALALRCAAQARALIDGRDFCIPEDVAELCVDVLAHRMIPALQGGVRQGAEEAGWVLREILDRTPVPL